MERLQKFLARAGVASRRAAEKLMLEGRVTVNGEVADRPGTQVDPERDAIKVDGKRIHLRRSMDRYLLLHKPKGYITTVSDPEGRPTVMDLLPKGGSRIYPVGRLDLMTEGLLIFTDDGELARCLMHPSGKVEKTYRVKIRGVPSRDVLRSLEKGVVLEGRRTHPANVRVLKRADRNCWLEIRVTEGRKHLIRKMLQQSGHPVIKLVRSSYGGIDLGPLPRGECRSLTPGEVALLRRAAGLDRGRPGRSRQGPDRS